MSALLLFRPGSVAVALPRRPTTNLVSTYHGHLTRGRAVPTYQPRP